MRKTIAIITGVFEELNTSELVDDYSIGPIQKSKLYDNIVLAIPDNKHSSALVSLAQKFKIDFFIGDENNVCKRFREVLNHYPGEIISRFQLRASWVDMNLVQKSINLISNGYDYVDYDLDINYAMGCDTFSKKAFLKAENIISKMLLNDSNKVVYEFSPWALFQDNKRFNVGLINNIEKYTLEKSISIRNNLIKIIGDKENMIESNVKYPAIRYLKTKNFLNPRMNVAEISCGWGGGAAYLSKFCLQITAFDINATYIKYARKKYQKYDVDFIHGGDDFLDKFGKYDCIISLHTMEHVRDDQKFLKNIFKSLNVGGLFILEVPRLMPYPMGMPLWPFHHREYNLIDIRKLLNTHGFHILQEFGVSRNKYAHIDFSREAFMFILRK
jgi:2-polyprenyl-3-methyl-5-hydroxy-6-metoxy-1,4-benzoquinol methylase